MCSGIVMNNTHRPLDPEEFRGFALSDGLAPLVFINGADTKSAQMFALAHELAHIWLGQTALSNTTATSQHQNDVETWCNRVAAELLAPLEIVRIELRADETLEDTVARLVRIFKVSSLVILQRLRDARRLTWDELRTAYQSELDRISQLPKAEGGGDFYLTAADVTAGDSLGRHRRLPAGEESSLRIRLLSGLLGLVEGIKSEGNRIQHRENEGGTGR
jgi:hypothetical protein